MIIIIFIDVICFKNGFFCVPFPFFSYIYTCIYDQTKFRWTAYQLHKILFALPAMSRGAGMQPGVYMGVRRSESGGPHGTCNVAPAAGTRCDRTRQGIRLTAGN